MPRLSGDDAAALAGAGVGVPAALGAVPRAEGAAAAGPVTQSFHITSPPPGTTPDPRVAAAQLALLIRQRRLAP